MKLMGAIFKPNRFLMQRAAGYGGAASNSLPRKLLMLRVKTGPISGQVHRKKSKDYYIPKSHPTSEVF